MRIIIFIVLLSQLFSCKSGHEEVPVAEIVIRVDPSSARPVSFSDLVDTAYAVSLNFPDTAYLGMIEHLEVLKDGRILLMDPYVAESLLLLEADGSFVSWLQRKGQGPGEYSNLFTFSASPDASKVVIFDRIQISFHVYSLPDFKHLETYRYPNYIMHMHWMDEETMYIMNEDLDEKNRTLGLELFDWENKSLKNSFLQNNLVNAVELAYPNTFSKAGGRHYFAYQAPIITLFELGPEEISPKISIDFGKAAPEIGFFTGIDVDDAEDYLEENFKATWVKNYHLTSERLNFQYIYREPENHHYSWADLQTQQTKVYQNPTWAALKSGEMPIPIGRSEDYFIYAISFEELMPDFFNQPDILSQSLVREVNIAGFDPEQLYLLCVKYKDPFKP